MQSGQFGLDVVRNGNRPLRSHDPSGEGTAADDLDVVLQEKAVDVWRSINEIDDLTCGFRIAFAAQKVVERCGAEK